MVACRNYPHPPRPPATYAIPGGSTSVSTAAQLTAALATGTPIDIVLENGTYDLGAGGLFTLWQTVPHRVRARNVLGATVRNGFNVRAAAVSGVGPIIQGINFDVPDNGRTVTNAIVRLWDITSLPQILDCAFNGNSAVAYAVSTENKINCEALVLKRCTAHHFTDDGFRLSSNTESDPLTTAMTIEDINVWNVMRVPRESGGGTTESGLWVGHRANVKRFKARDCGWMGINNISSSEGSMYEHLDIDRCGVGVYFEHISANCQVRYFKIGDQTDGDLGGALVRVGFTFEWWANNAAYRAHGNLIEKGLVNSRKFGAYFDEGTYGNTVQNVKFRQQAAACIDHYADYGSGAANVFSGNDYDERDSTPDLFMQDTFTGTDGTLLQNYTGELGATWTKHAAATTDLQIATNRVRPSANNLTGLYSASPSLPGENYEVNATLRFLTLNGDAAEAGVLGRWDTAAAGTGTFYRARYRENIAAWCLEKVVAGVLDGAFTVNIFTSQPVAGSSHTLTLRMLTALQSPYDVVVSMRLDGVQIASVTDPEAGKISGIGKVGVRGQQVTNVGNATGVHIDSISANEVDAPAATLLTDHWNAHSSGQIAW